MSLVIPRRKLICDAVESLLQGISTANGYRTDFDRIRYWQDVDTEYGRNHLTFKDTENNYADLNREHEHELMFEVGAIVYGAEPAEAGTNALADLIEVLGANESLGGLVHRLRLIDSSKDVDTATRSRCFITLDFLVVYRLERFKVG